MKTVKGNDKTQKERKENFKNDDGKETLEREKRKN